MKSAKTYSLLITVMVVLFVALALMVNEIVGFKHTIIDYLVVGLVGMVGTFLIVRWYFIRFVETKIDPIIKTIQSYTMSQKSIRDKIDSGDVIDDLNKEVKVWADNHSEEIRKLRKLERYRKDFLGNVSHELKTPIFNIQGYILTLLDGGMEDNSINTLYLKRAERSTNRMINIVEDLDSIARLESGEFKLKLEVFNLVKVVEEVIEYLEMPANQKKIKVVFDKSYNRAIRVKADRKRIVEVFSNLIGKNLPRIFERFYRVDMSRSRESGGTGLGLSIVKHIIQAHNQTITVRSRVNEGSTFIFSMNKA